MAAIKRIALSRFFRINASLGVKLGRASTRYSSLSALCATAGVVLFYLITGWVGLSVIATMAVLVFLKHRENIRRLLAGQESKIGARS